MVIISLIWGPLSGRCKINISNICNLIQVMCSVFKLLASFIFLQFQTTFSINQSLTNLRWTFLFSFFKIVMNILLVILFCIYYFFKISRWVLKHNLMVSKIHLTLAFPELHWIRTCGTCSKLWSIKTKCTLSRRHHYSINIKREYTFQDIHYILYVELILST